MNALDAAEAIREQATTSLHDRERTQRFLTSGPCQTTGKPPAATINANTGKDIRTHGAAFRFQHTAGHHPRRYYGAEHQSIFRGICTHFNGLARPGARKQSIQPTDLFRETQVKTMDGRATVVCMPGTARITTVVFS